VRYGDWKIVYLENRGEAVGEHDGFDEGQPTPILRGRLHRAAIV
jgi:hypothetical protein